MKTLFKIALVILIAMAAILPFARTVQAAVTVIKFTGIQTCTGPDMFPYMTFLSSGNIRVKDWPLDCTNAVYDIITGAPVDPINIRHIGYYNALMKPDGTGQYWGDCPGSGWQAHFEGTMTPTGMKGFIHGTGEIGGPFEGMMFQMTSVSGPETGGLTILTGQLIIQNP